jgi:hypothetical protein
MYATYMVPGGMKFGIGVQAILRLYLSNLKGCYIDITDGKELQNAPLRPALVARYTCQVS